jgi:hypothetical protein
VGLRNRIAILSESYSYASYKDRVKASAGFVRSIWEYTAENKEKVRNLLVEARAATVKAGKQPGDTDLVVLRQEPIPVGKPHALLGFVEEIKDGRRRPTTTPKEYEVMYWGGSRPTLSVRLPYAYVLPARLAKVVENLQRHGVDVEELREDAELTLETYRIDKVKRTPSFQKHQPVSLEATMNKEARRLEAGAIVIRTGQPLGALAAYLLEPQSEDGLTTWNFLDEVLQEGKPYPILRLPVAAPLNLMRVRPLPEGKVLNKTGDEKGELGAAQVPNLGGSPGKDELN